MEHYPQAEYVRAMINLLSQHLLRRKICKRAHQHFWIGFHCDGNRGLSVEPGFTRGWFCQSEVQHFDQTIGPRHDIFRLDVAMHYACRVCGGQSIRDLNRDIHGFFQIQCLVCDLLTKRLAVHKFSSNEVRTSVPPDLVNGDDVGMIERGCSTRFALKTLDLCVVFSKLCGQDLDGNLAVEHYVVRQINLTHAARAE